VAKLVLIYDFRFTNYDLKVMFLTRDQDFGSNNFIFALQRVESVVNVVLVEKVAIAKSISVCKNYNLPL